MAFVRFVVAVLLVCFGFVSISTAGVPTRNKPDAEAGKDIWMQSCWQCHGRGAKGDGPAAPALAKPVPSIKGLVTSETMPEFIATVREGRGAMPGYGDVLTKRDAKRVLIYVQTLDKPQKKKGGKNKAGPNKSRKSKAKGKKAPKGKVELPPRPPKGEE